MRAPPRWALPLGAAALGLAAGVWTYGFGTLPGHPPPVRVTVDERALEGFRPMLRYEVMSAPLVGPARIHSLVHAFHGDRGISGVRDWAVTGFRARCGSREVEVSSEGWPGMFAPVETSLRLAITDALHPPGVRLELDRFRMRRSAFDEREWELPIRVAVELPVASRAEAAPSVLLQEALDRVHEGFDSHFDVRADFDEALREAAPGARPPVPAELRRLLGEQVETLELARRALEGVVESPVAPRLVAGGPFLYGHRSLARWVALDGYLRATDGDWDAAMDRFEAVLEGSMTLAATDERLIPLMMAVSMTDLGWDALIDALDDAAAPLPMERLDALLERLDALDVVAAAERTIQAEIDAGPESGWFGGCGWARWSPVTALFFRTNEPLLVGVRFKARRLLELASLVRARVELEEEIRRTGRVPITWPTREGVSYEPAHWLPPEEVAEGAPLFVGFRVRSGRQALWRGLADPPSCPEARRARAVRLETIDRPPRSDPPGETVALAASPALSIDRTEVTVAAYRTCVEAGACPTEGLDAFPECNWTTPDRDDHPINCIASDDFAAARAYCAWAGKRLPTLAEWRRAAGDEEESTYPWGAEAPTCAHAILLGPVPRLGEERGAGMAPGCGCNSTWPVGLTPTGESRDGVRDLIGNVAELVLDERGAPMLVGGAWFDVTDDRIASTQLLHPVAPDKPRRQVGWGFRCVMDAAER